MNQKPEERSGRTAGRRFPFGVRLSAGPAARARHVLYDVPAVQRRPDGVRPAVVGVGCTAAGRVSGQRPSCGEQLGAIVPKQRRDVIATGFDTATGRYDAEIDEFADDALCRGG